MVTSCRTPVGAKGPSPGARKVTAIARKVTWESWRRSERSATLPTALASRSPGGGTPGTTTVTVRYSAHQGHERPSRRTFIRSRTRRWTNSPTSPLSRAAPANGKVGPALSSLVVRAGQQFDLQLTNGEGVCSVPLRDLQRFLPAKDHVPALITVSTPLGSKQIGVSFSVDVCWRRIAMHVSG